MPTQHTTAADAAQPAARPHHARIDWSPFLNTTGRLLMLLTQLDGDLPPVRDLARRLGCSIGAVSGGLRELEVDGYLARGAGRSFTLLNMGVQFPEHVQETEQSVQTSEQAADRVPTPTAAGGVQLSEQSVQNSEPPHTPHNDTLAASSSSYRAPLETDLRAAGVYPGLARKVAARCPDRTIAEFESDVALAEQQGKTTPVPYVATLWADGDRVRGAGRSFTLLNMGVQSAEHVQETEQSVQTSEQAADRVPTPTAAGGVQLSEQSVQNSEPPHTPHNDTLAASSSSYRAPLETDLRAAGVYPGLARKVAARCPDRTIAEFQADVALAERQGKQNPVPYVATLWADGDRVREVSHGRSDLPPADRRGPAEPGPARNFADLVW